MSTHTYTIQEASGLTGLPSSTLRYYESIGVIRPIERDASSKHRIYSEDDLHILTMVACLSATGMGVENMRAYIANSGKGADVADAQMKLLEIQKQRLIEQAKAIQMSQEYVALKTKYWAAVKAGDMSAKEELSKRSKALSSEIIKNKEKQYE